jgi:hypothetical protein
LKKHFTLSVTASIRHLRLFQNDEERQQAVAIVESVDAERVGKMAGFGF